MKVKNVCIAGNFDPIHRGHIDHIAKAAMLGDTLTVILTRDDQIVAKKGFCLLPYEDRKAVLLATKYVTSVVRSIDRDGCCAMTLKRIKPDIFAKGGEWTEQHQVPAAERAVCNTIGCDIVYGIGNKLNSSTDCVKRALEKMIEES